MVGRDTTGAGAIPGDGDGSNRASKRTNVTVEMEVLWREVFKMGILSLWSIPPIAIPTVSRLVGTLTPTSRRTHSSRP
jgi:hypothetical protein